MRLSGAKNKFRKKEEEVGRYVRLGEGGEKKIQKVVAPSRWGCEGEKI